MTGSGEASAGTDDGALQGVWGALVRAGRWLLDTFRGHASVDELREREP